MPISQSDARTVADYVVQLLLSRSTGAGADAQKGRADPAEKAKAKDREKDNGAPDKKGGGQLEKSLAPLIQKIVAILAPAAIVASIIGSQASGIGLLLNTVKIFGNVIGSTLYPVVVLASSVILSLADIINEALLPNLEQWYEFIITNGIAAIAWLEKAIVSAANGAIDFVNEIIKASAEVEKMAATYLVVRAIFQKGIGDNAGAEESIKDAIKHMVRAAQMGEEQIAKQVADSLTDPLRKFFGDGSQFTDRVRKNIGVANQEFRQENLPQSSVMGLAAAALNAQSAALNITPYQQKTLDLLNRQADAMDKVAAKIQPGVSE